MIELTDFKKDSDVPQEVIEKYRDVLPEELIGIWENYGFGSFYGGFLKTVNPDEYRELLIEAAPFFGNEIVIFTTGMADLITWRIASDKQKTVAHILLFRNGDLDTVAAEDLEFFFEDIVNRDDFQRNKELYAAKYFKAVEQQGEPSYNEAFGYTPLLVLGGNPDKIDSLQKVDLKTHIILIAAMYDNEEVFPNDEPRPDEVLAENEISSEPKKKKFFGLF